MCVINLSDRYRLLRKGQHIPNAYAVDGYCDDTEGSQGETITVQMVHQGAPVQEVHDVPEHLQQLFRDSSQHLNSEQTIQLANLLTEFQDVFAPNEFDLGHFRD